MAELDPETNPLAESQGAPATPTADAAAAPRKQKASKWFSGMVGSISRRSQAPEPEPVAASAAAPAGGGEPTVPPGAEGVVGAGAHAFEPGALEADAAPVVERLVEDRTATETVATEAPATAKAPASENKKWFGSWSSVRKETPPAVADACAISSEPATAGGSASEMAEAPISEASDARAGEPGESPADPALASPAGEATPAAEVAAATATAPPDAEMPVPEAPAAEKRGWFGSWRNSKAETPAPAAAEATATAAESTAAVDARSPEHSGAPGTESAGATAAPAAEVAATASPDAEMPASEASAAEKKGWFGSWRSSTKTETPAPAAAEGTATAAESAAAAGARPAESSGTPAAESADAPAAAAATAAAPSPGAASTAVPSPNAATATAAASTAVSQAGPLAVQDPAPAPESPDLDAAAAGIITDVKAFWRFLRRVLIIGFAVTAVVLFAEVVNIGRFFYWIHPFFGTAFFLVLLGGIGALAGRAVYRYWTTPQALLPPPMPPKPEDVTTADLSRQVDFVDRYLQGLAANAELSAQSADIAATRAKVASLIARFAQPVPPEPAAVRDEVRAITDQDIPKLLAPLDAKVDQMVWREALAVGIGTAVSPNGMLDAFIVLWRNLNMISRISRIYFGRPGLTGTLVIARDVAGSILVASYLESVAEAAGSLIGAQLGSLAGSVAGPMMEGMTNALVTVRIGCLAKDRCRAFRRWDQATRQGALKAVGARSKEISARLWKEILAASGLGLGKLGEKIKSGLAASGKAIGSGVGKLFRRRKADVDTGAGEAVPEAGEALDGAEGVEGVAPA